MDKCPPRHELEQLVTERTSALVAETVRAHLRECGRCQAELDAISDDAELRHWHDNLAHELIDADEGKAMARIRAEALAAPGTTASTTATLFSASRARNSSDAERR
jgi:hypothetical protein